MNDKNKTLFKRRKRDRETRHKHKINMHRKSQIACRFDTAYAHFLWLKSKRSGTIKITMIIIIIVESAACVHRCNLYNWAGIWAGTNWLKFITYYHYDRLLLSMRYGIIEIQLKTTTTTEWTERRKKKAKNKSAYEHAIFDNDLWFFSWAGCKRPKVKTFTEFSMRKSYWQIMKIIMYFCAVEWIAERNFEHANCTQVVRFICAVISVRWFYKQQPKANSLIVDVLST